MDTDFYVSSRKLPAYDKYNEEINNFQKEEISQFSLTDNTKSLGKWRWTKRFKWRINDDHTPPEIYNKTLCFSVLVFGVLGAARGYDEGNISGSSSHSSFRETFGFNDPKKSETDVSNLKSNITAMVQLGSIGGCILAMFLVDKLGKVRSLTFVCIIWICAAIIQITSTNIGQLYAGRLIEGFAIGQTTTIGPTYMAEVSPKAIRGLCGCIFSGALYLGIMLGYFANYGSALHISDESNNQWIIPTSMKIPIAGLLLIGSLFCHESPRWLLKVNNPDKAIQALSNIRNLPIDHPYILSEISDINEQISKEKEENSGSSYLEICKTLIFVKSIRYRFFAIILLSHVLGPWTGANAITIYAPDLFALSGIVGKETLKMTAIFGVVKFVSAYICAFFVIDFLGRRKALYIGLIIQLLSILYFSIFLAIVPEASNDNPSLSGSESRASKGAIASLFMSGVGWSLGFNAFMYMIGPEILPIKVRSFAQSLSMALHFANQYGNSKALPKMLIAMNNYGAFFFFVGVMIISMFWAWFFVPELSGRSLESIEEIFKLPWYLIGRKGAQLSPDFSEVNKISHSKDSHGNTYESVINYNLETSKASQEIVGGNSKEDVNSCKEKS